MPFLTPAQSQSSQHQCCETALQLLSLDLRGVQAGQRRGLQRVNRPTDVRDPDDSGLGPAGSTCSLQPLWPCMVPVYGGLDGAWWTAGSGVEALPQILMGASSSSRLGCMRKISLEVVHRFRISASVSDTCFPGLPFLTSKSLPMMSSSVASSIWC